LDTDGDSLGNECDPDDDNDGVEDASDCAPLDAGVWSEPVEVTGLSVDYAAGTQLSWSGQEPGTAYDIAGGDLALLRSNGNVSDAVCLQDNQTGTNWEDSRPDPGSGVGLYYIIRAQNTCGGGSYGASSGGTNRSPGDPCP